MLPDSGAGVQLRANWRDAAADFAQGGEFD